MKKSILLEAVLIALVSLCLVFASCDSGSSGDDPAPSMTIGEILGTVDFPDNMNSQWKVAGAEKGCYRSSDGPGLAFTCLNSHMDLYKLEWPCQADGADFKYVKDGVEILFTMEDGRLRSITVSNSEYISGTYEPIYTVSVTSVTLDKTTMEITVGDPDVKLTATVAPENATDKTVSWASDKTEFATVDNQGNVHAVAPGIANITVTTTDGNKTATCAVTVKAALPAGALPGKFSVSATKQVYFSKGNLWADGDKTLHFEDAQWKSTPTSQGTMDASHVSHFTWSSTVADAVGTSFNGENLFCDENNKVSVDGSEAIYYALSKDEWTYLFNTRTVNGGTGKDKSYSLNITYGGKMGLILYLDNYTGSVLSGTVEALPEGVVFLPAAGDRVNYDVYDVGTSGFYLSSTAKSGPNVNCVFFSKDDFRTDGSKPMGSGNSIRLVTDVK